MQSFLNVEQNSNALALRSYDAEAFEFVSSRLVIREQEENMVAPFNESLCHLSECVPFEAFDSGRVHNPECRRVWFAVA